MFDDVEKYVDQFLEELGEYDEDEFACLRDKVYARVEALPERTKEIFKAVVLNNLTYQQVGERFGITVNTVKTLYYRALKQLKEELGWKRFGVVFYYSAINFYTFILLKLFFLQFFLKKLSSLFQSSGI